MHTLNKHLSVDLQGYRNPWSRLIFFSLFFSFEIREKILFIQIMSFPTAGWVNSRTLESFLKQIARGNLLEFSPPSKCEKLEGGTMVRIYYSWGEQDSGYPSSSRIFPSLAIFFLPHRQARGVTCLREAASAKAGGRFSVDVFSIMTWWVISMVWGNRILGEIRCQIIGNRKSTKGEKKWTKWPLS